MPHFFKKGLDFLFLFAYTNSIIALFDEVGIMEACSMK